MLWTPSRESIMAMGLHCTKAVERRWMVLQVQTESWSKRYYLNRCDSPFCRNCRNISAVRRHSKINEPIKSLQRTFTQNRYWKLVFYSTIGIQFWVIAFPSKMGILFWAKIWVAVFLDPFPTNWILYKRKVHRYSWWSPWDNYKSSASRRRERCTRNGSALSFFWRIWRSRRLSHTDANGDVSSGICFLLRPHLGISDAQLN